MTEQELKLLKRLGENDTYGKALRKWCKEEIEKRESIYSASDWDEVNRNKGAIREVKRLLSVLTDEKPQRNPKNEYV